MPSSETIRGLSRLGGVDRIGAIAVAGQAVETRADADREPADRGITLDNPPRDLPHIAC